MTRHQGWIIHHYDRVASTMEQAAALARAGAHERTAVVAGEQTAGRGRGGRSWVAPAGTALFCTLLLRPRVSPARLSVFPLIVGVAVAEAIERLSASRVSLKWPNDLWMGQDPERQKVGGILVTSRLRGSEIDVVLAGIGVNLSSPQSALPPGATSVLAASGIALPPDALLSTLLATVDDAYSLYLAADGRPPLTPWRCRAALLGDHVVVEADDQQLQGTFVDVDDDGALLLRDGQGIPRRIVAGDLTRGPRAAIQRS
jgi:BirA family biotin operon repressor/biotin-[acetyl-CoA-carboxylase] ligase